MISCLFIIILLLKHIPHDCVRLIEHKSVVFTRYSSSENLLKSKCSITEIFELSNLTHSQLNESPSNATSLDENFKFGSIIERDWNIEDVIHCHDKRNEKDREYKVSNLVLCYCDTNDRYSLDTFGKEMSQETSGWVDTSNEGNC